MEFSAQQIAMLLGGKLTGDANKKVRNVAGLEKAQEGDLCFLCDDKYLNFLPTTKASVVLMTESIPFTGETNATIIRVNNARASMAQLLQLVAKTMNPVRKGIEQPVYISEGVDIPEDAYIGAFTYIGKNVIAFAEENIIDTIESFEQSKPGGSETVRPADHRDDIGPEFLYAAQNRKRAVSLMKAGRHSDDFRVSRKNTADRLFCFLCSSFLRLANQIAV